MAQRLTQETVNVLVTPSTTSQRLTSVSLSVLLPFASPQRLTAVSLSVLVPNPTSGVYARRTLSSRVGSRSEITGEI